MHSRRRGAVEPKRGHTVTKQHLWSVLQPGKTTGDVTATEQVGGQRAQIATRSLSVIACIDTSDSCFQNCSCIQNFRRGSLAPLRSLTRSFQLFGTGWATALSYASASPHWSVSPDERVSEKNTEPYAIYMSHENCLPDILRWNSNTYADVMVMRASVAKVRPFIGT